jgi:hypothetical protein
LSELKFSTWFSHFRAARAGLIGLAVLVAVLPQLPVEVAAARSDKVDDAVRHMGAQSAESVPVLITRRSTSGALDNLNAHGAQIRS